MTLVLELPPDVEAKLSKEAAQQKQNLEDYILERLLADADIVLTEAAPEHIPTLAERLKGIVGVLHSQNGLGISDASERAEEGLHSS